MAINILININVSILEIADKRTNNGNKYINQHKNIYTRNCSQKNKTMAINILINIKIDMLEIAETRRPLLLFYCSIRLLIQILAFSP